MVGFLRAVIAVGMLGMLGCSAELGDDAESAANDLSESEAGLSKGRAATLLVWLAAGGRDAVPASLAGCLPGSNQPRSCSNADLEKALEAAGAGVARDICMRGGRASYECTPDISLAKAICMSGGHASYECSSDMSVAKAVCMSGHAGYECDDDIPFGKAVCMAGGRAGYECSSDISVPKAICMSHGRAAYECASDITLGKAICLSGGRASYDCTGL